MRKQGWLLLIALLAVPILVWACPTCKDALADNPESRGFAKGVYFTIVLLLGTLFSMVGFIIYKIVKEAQHPLKAPDNNRPPSA